MGCGRSKQKDVASNDSTLSRLSEDGGKFVLIKFFQPSNQDPSMSTINKAYANLTNDYPNIIFLEADASINPEAVNELDISEYPAFVAFQEHTEVDRYEGLDLEQVYALVKGLQGRSSP